MKIKKWVWVMIGVVVLVAVAGGSAYILRSRSHKSDPRAVSAVEDDSAPVAQQATTTDVSYPPAVELKKQLNGDPDQYDQLMQAGELKAYYGKLAEAKSYFEAALSVVKADDKERLETTRVRLYVLAVKMNDTASMDAYKKLLSADAVAKLEQPENSH